MEETKDHTEAVTDDIEDIPSDFFDDFSKDDFVEGLSVIDSWDEEDKLTKERLNSRVNRIASETLDSVKDLRELIRDNRDKSNSKEFIKYNNKYKWTKSQAHRSTSQQRRSASRSRLNDYIKPGSRRDPSKTKEAIRKDKEEKVKEILAKRLESSDNLRPPGTELDDFFEEKPKEPKKLPTVHDIVDKKPAYKSPPARNHRSPGRYRSPRRSPRPRWSPRYQLRRSPQQQYRRISPNKPRRIYSPVRRSPRRSSPRRSSPRRSSPRKRSPYRTKFSRSPRRRTHNMKRSRSRSPHPRDSFLYPKNVPSVDSGPPAPYQPDLMQVYPAQNEYSGPVPGYSYPQVPVFSAGYSAPYDYGTQSVLPQPVQGTIVNPVPSAIFDPPSMVPAPATVTPATPLQENTTPCDALAQLVAEGKISKADYLKLAPNKGACSSMDTKTRVMVLSRCSTALMKLTKLLLPNRLMMNNNLVGSEPKSIGPVFCSPLKRQAAVEFHFTKTNGPSLAQQDKQLVDSIISTLELDQLVSRSKKKPSKDMKDAAVQTMKPFCEVCEIRESTQFCEVGTATSPEYFTSTVHTQVVEQDLVNSKAIFNPSGSVADGAPISIAHMTPAQLVSQLAARAKTLKQSDPVPSPPLDQFGRRHPNYDGRGGSSGQYQNYNYRY